MKSDEVVKVRDVGFGLVQEARPGRQRRLLLKSWQALMCWDCLFGHPVLMRLFGLCDPVRWPCLLAEGRCSGTEVVCLVEYINEIRVGNVKDPGRWYRSLRKSLIVASTDRQDVRARHWGGSRRQCNKCKVELTSG